MDEIREEVITKILKDINMKIQTGHLVRYRGKNVQEVDVVEMKKGFSKFKRVYIRYSDGTVNVLSFASFLTRRVEVT